MADLSTALVTLSHKDPDAIVESVAKHAEEAEAVAGLAKGWTVADNEAARKTSAIINRIGDRKKRLEKMRKGIVEGATKATSAVNAAFRELRKPLDEADRELKRKLNKFLSEEERKKREAAEAERMRAAQEAQDHRAVAESAIAIADNAAGPVLENMREVKRVRLVITDLSKIPLEFMAPKEREILAALKDGREVPGATLEHYTEMQRGAGRR